ncbi:MAG: MmcQ/YjbR family DNA-binding protein [Bryobacteraceae bacterium]
MTKASAEKQIQRVRAICLGYPGAIEKVSHGEPTFFTPKRVFAMIANNHHGDGHVAAWLPAAPGVQGELIGERPDAFYYPPYVGKGGWVGVELAQVGDDELGALIHEAYALTLVKDKPKR